MFIFRQFMLVIIATSLALNTFAQQRGQILKAGDNVLDPNGDGFITESGGAFSIDGYYVDEFELKMFGLPKAGEGETEGDAVQSCATTDLATDTTGFSAYGVLDGDNLIFRFRIAGNRNSVEAYTILIDTDNKIGPADPNYTPDNPGFEVDITLIKNQNKGVFVYDIDGIDNCPSVLASYPFSTHFQSSVAGTTSCNDADYFYDFYVPFQILTDIFGITASTEIRFVAVTNVSATCAMSGNISDVGGVNDDDFASLEDMFTALSDAQCPTAIEDLCQTCDGFKVGVTEKPTINQPVKVGESAISGTSEALANIFVSVFDGAGVLVEDLVSSSDVNGEWALTLTNPLQNEDSVTARAQIPGSCSSGISESDISFAIVIINTEPVISGSTSTLNYTENAVGLSIFDDIGISDVDDTEMDSAWVTVTANYNGAEDVITLPPDQGLNVFWEPSLNRVRIYGKASLAVYESVIQGITYSNSSDNPDISTRSFSVSVHDGLDESNVLSRDLDITRTNDPPVISGNAITIEYLETDTDTLVDNTITISDVDDTSLEGAIISFTQGYDQAEDTLQFTDQNGITGSFDDLNGVLTLTGSASVAAYQAALRSIKYENLDAGNDVVKVIDDGTTRIIAFQVDDGDDLSNIHSISIDINIAANVGPVFVDNLIDQIPVDTVVIDLLEDTVLDTCLVAYDADGDRVIIQPGFTYENNEGVAVLTGDLCFTYTPPENYEGSEYITFTGCDDVTSDPLCDDVVVEINIIPVNDLPNIVDGSNNPIDTVYFTATEDTPDNFCIDAIDIESNILEFSEATSETGNGNPSIPNPANLCFDYIGNTDFFGYDTLQLVVCEQGSSTQCDTIIAIIEVLGVNDPPVVEVSGSPVDTVHFDALEDVITQMCVTATDPDMDVLQVVDAYKNEGPGVFEHLPLGDLCFYFQSLKDSTGMVYGEIVVCDDASPALCDTVVVAINILPVNDPPVIVDPDNNPLFEPFDTLHYSFNEDEPFNFCIDAIDPDGDPYVLTSAVSIDGNGSYVITDPTNLCTTITPTPDFNGIERATLTVCETVGADPQCASIVVEFDILPVNDPPTVLVGGLPVDTVRFDATEDILSQFCLTTDDPEGDNTYLVDAFLVEGPGVFEHLPLGDLCFFFQSETDSTGIVYGKVVVCDDASPALCDTIVVEINIIPVNDPPVIVDENNDPIFEISDTLHFQVNEDEPLDFCIDAVDADGDPLILSDAQSTDGNGSYIITDPNNMCVSFTPDPDFNGSDEGVLTVCEDNGPGSQCASIVVIVEVIPVNDPPVIQDDPGTIDTVYYTTNEDNPVDICLVVNDIEGDPLSLDEVFTNSTDGVFDVGDPNDLCVTFTPNEDFNGVVTGEFAVCDNQSPSLCDTVIVIIDVLPLNDPPKYIENNTPIIDTLIVVTSEDTEVEFCLNIVDPDGDMVTDPILTSSTNLGTYTTNFGTEYCYVFTPLSEVNGTEYATLETCDDTGLCTDIVIQIIIEPVNDTPIGGEDYFEHDIYTPFSGDLSANDSDPEGTRLEISLEDGSQIHGDLDLQSDGEFVYTPSRDYVGTEIFTYRLCDTGSPVPVCVTVTVTFELNDPLIVWQALSPNGDNMNDLWIIEGIDLFPDNKVQIFDRYNNVIYEVEGYNNMDKVWYGQSNRGLFNDQAPTGTYFYRIDLGDEKMSKPLSGFIILKKD
ncbi:MAG: tandem-95 repeat protein [Bacteroidota bacterium]